MDLREKKTRRSITNAFLTLRAKKPLERITVKELSELAEISKATFYLHYHDIFDLSETLQNEVIQQILAGIDRPERLLTDPAALTFELCHAFYAQQTLIDTLFSGNQAAVLPLRIEEELLSLVHQLDPAENLRRDMLLTYRIQGSYYVFQTYQKRCGMEEVLAMLSSANGET